MGWNFLASLLKYWSVFSAVFVAVCGSSLKVLSVTRSRDKGDVFELNLETSNCPASCRQLGADEVNGGARGSGCFCHCANKTRPTFYRTRSGQHGCVKDRDVLTDTPGNICDFYTSTAQQLEALNLHVRGNTKLKQDGFCDQVQISRWKFYYNTSWMFPKSDIRIFYTRSYNKSKAFLFWKDHLDSFYKGLLIKVIIRCTYEGKTDDRCLMLKAQGTHQYVEIVKTIPSKPPSSVSFPTEKDKNVQKSSVSLVESTKFNVDPVPTGDYSKANDKQIWIAVSFGLAGVVLIIIIVITVFLVLKCRRNCKQERRGPHHQPAEQPATPAVCSSLHDYEYVHYPCLVDGVRTRPVTPRGNPMYERSKDNKLIIWTPGHSGTLTRPNNQSADTTAPHLPYQRLLTRTSTSSPECIGAIMPVSPAGVEEVFPYQKLVRTLPSLRRDQQGCGHAEELPSVSSPEGDESLPYQRLFRSMPSLRREEQGCCRREEPTAEVGGEEGPTKAYQSLSLERNPLYSLKECDGYAKVDAPSRPESTEYDYARVSTELDPVKLYKLFCGSQSDLEEMPRASLEICIGDLDSAVSDPNADHIGDLDNAVSDPNADHIGDLDNAVSDPNADQKRSSAIRERSSVSSCSGDYENCLCKSSTKRNSSTGADENDEGVKPKDLGPATSYEDLSGGCHIDLEEYIEMGKRRSTLIGEGNDSTDREVEDSGHEYFVLERVMESSEGEIVDES